MGRYTYTGKLTNFGRSPFPNSTSVNLWVEPKTPGFASTGLMADRRIPVTVESNGDFSVRLEASASVRPEVTYLLRAEWFESGTLLGWTEWPFRAAVGGGNISDAIELPVGKWQIAYGYGPPPAYITAGLYLDISGENPVLYAPEGAGI